MLALLFIVVLTLGESTGLFGGGSQAMHGDQVVKLRKLGFNEDPTTFSHEILVPWARPFKPGYCVSWEWHTDKRYRDVRIQVCKEMSGSKNFDCKSSDGRCHDKCPYKNGSFPFWRIRNGDSIPFLWTIRTVQMFESTSSRYPLQTKPTKGYASTFFGPGYYPSNAFDNNPDSIWVSNGASSPGINWIAYEFDYPVTVNSIRIVGEADHPTRTPATLYVEGSCEKYFRTFSSEWSISNTAHETDKRFSRPRGTRRP